LVGEVGLGPGDIVLVLLPKQGGTAAPQFSAHVLWPTAGWIKMLLGKEVYLGPGGIVLNGDVALSLKMGTAALPNVRPIYCGQTAEWIKMPLGTVIGLGPSDIVLDGDPAPFPKTGQQPPIFGPSLLWPNGWMDQDAAWYGGMPRSRPHCV